MENARTVMGEPMKRSVSLADRVYFGLAQFIGAICIPIYKLIFGRSDMAVAHKNERRLLVDVRKSFAGVLSEHTGIVSTEGRERRPAFDFAIAVIKFNEIGVRIARGRGELRIQIAPAHDLNDWNDIEVLWRVLHLQEWPVSPSPYDSLNDVSDYLNAHWDKVVAAMSAQHYSVTSREAENLCALSFENQRKPMPCQPLVRYPE
jgi:hypothetical protein